MDKTFKDICANVLVCGSIGATIGKSVGSFLGASHIAATLGGAIGSIAGIFVDF